MPKGLYTSIIFKYSICAWQLRKHLGIDSSTDYADWYSNLFLNAYINRHVHAEYLKMTTQNLKPYYSIVEQKFLA